MHQKVICTVCACACAEQLLIISAALMTDQQSGSSGIALSVFVLLYLLMQEWQQLSGTCIEQSSMLHSDLACLITLLPEHIAGHSQAAGVLFCSYASMHMSYPKTSMASFTANGKPHKGLMLVPFAALASIAAASFNACSQLCCLLPNEKNPLDCRVARHGVGLSPRGGMMSRQSSEG